jgi:hypothetical protein
MFEKKWEIASKPTFKKIQIHNIGMLLEGGVNGIAAWGWFCMHQLYKWALALQIIFRNISKALNFPLYLIFLFTMK